MKMHELNMKTDRLIEYSFNEIDDMMLNLLAMFNNYSVDKTLFYDELSDYVRYINVERKNRLWFNSEKIDDLNYSISVKLMNKYYLICYLEIYKGKIRPVNSWFYRYANILVTDTDGVILQDLS